MAMRPDFMLASPFAESFAARGADLAAAWLLTYVVHSTVIVLIVWVVTSLPRVTDTVREVIWKFALVGGLVTASVQTAVVREPLGGQWKLSSRTPAPAGPVRIAVRAESAAAERRFVYARPSGTQWSAALLIAWLTTSGAALLWLSTRHSRTLRALGDRTSLDGTNVRASLDALLVRTAVSKRITLTCSASITSPVALSGNEICLPRQALLELTPNEQEGMLAHEVAHLVRRDPQWLVVARVIETLLFMQPLNRLARHRLQEVAEFLCDDWAVSRVREPITLAKCLAAVAEWVARAPRVRVPRLEPMSAMVEVSGSPLVRRVGRILGARQAPHARTPRFAFAASACVLLAFIAVAPRVSVAHATPVGAVFAFVRAVSSPGGAAHRDSMVVFRMRGGPTTRVNSLVRQRRAEAAGGIVGRANVIIVERAPRPDR
jgi:beta-lactamase regulating signal transducer with metallopeptidase domain